MAVSLSAGIRVAVATRKAWRVRKRRTLGVAVRAWAPQEGRLRLTAPTPGLPSQRPGTGRAWPPAVIGALVSCPSEGAAHQGRDQQWVILSETAAGPTSQKSGGSEACRNIPLAAPSENPAVTDARSGVHAWAAILTIAASVIAVLGFFGIKGCNEEPEPPPSPPVSQSPSAESTKSKPEETTTLPLPPPSLQPQEKYLADLDPLPGGYPPERGSADLQGRTFAQSVSFSVDKSSLPSSYAEYNLGSNWKSLNATIGVRDDSPTGGRITFQVSVDGRSAFRRELGVGESEKVSIDVTGALRLILKVSFTAGEYYDNYSYGSWGDARLSR